METLLKKKILYIITKSNWGGAQRHVFDLATNLPKDKYDVVVASGGNGPLLKKLGESGIRTISISQLGRDPNAIKDAISIATIFKIIRSEKPNILHLHSSKIGGIGAFIGRFYNLSQRFIYFFHYLFGRFLRLSAFNLQLSTIIYTAHGWAFKENRPIRQKWVIGFFSWLTIVLSHKTIAVSNDDLEKAPKLMTEGKVVMVHNGIAPFECLPRTEAQKEIFGKMSISPNNILIGWIGELHKNKGLFYAIKAIDEIRKQNADKDRPLILGAIGDGEERKNLEILVKQSELEKSVFLAGRKENGHKFLSAFDLFVFPSLKEGLPYALLEAGLFGLPLVATDVGGASDIITDMETGILIRPSDVKEISNALKFFIQNPEKIAEFGGRLKKKISEEFSLSKMVEKTVKVYEY